MPNIRWTQELFVSSIPNSLRLLDRFHGIGKYYRFRCAECRHIHQLLARDVVQSMRRKGCSWCNGARQKTHAEYRKELVRLPFEVVDTYVTAMTPINHKCLKCGHTWLVRPNAILSGQNCPKCVKRGGQVVVQGKKFYVQSALEQKALNWIVNNTKLKASQLQTTGLLQFTYTHGNRRRSYRPDISAGKNSIVEVKSTYTAGLHQKFFHRKGADAFQQLKSKALAVQNEGLRFRLFLYCQWGKNFTHRLKVPTNWTELTQRQMVRALKELNPDHEDILVKSCG